MTVLLATTTTTTTTVMMMAHPVSMSCCNGYGFPWIPSAPRPTAVNRSSPSKGTLLACLACVVRAV